MKEPRQDYGKPMKCDACEKCNERPAYPGKCLYNGPFRFVKEKSNG